MKEWGSELWDRVENVDQRFQDSIQKNDRLIRFLREKAQIDHDYSKQLKKLASKYEKGTNDSNFTTERAFSSLLLSTNNIANQYEQISEEVAKTCIQPFNHFNNDLITTRKDLRSEYSKQLKVLDECGKEVDRSKDNWVRQFKNSEKAKLQYEKADQDDHVTKADVEKSRQNKEQKRNMAEDAKNEYAQKLVKCNEQQKNHHTQLIPAILNNYQTSYIKTADEFNHILLNFCQAEEKFRPLIKSCLDDFAANAGKIDSTKDSEYIVEELKTGYHPPEDIPFEDIEQESKSGGGQKITRLGGFFNRNKKVEKPPQEDMSHLPPVQRKRALKNMKKDVEKILEKEKKELKALEKMKDLSVTNPKMGKPETFQSQILECQKRIQDHERRIAQVDSWLGLEPSQPSTAIQNSFPSPSQSVFPPTDQTPVAVSPKVTSKDSNYTDPIRLQSNQPPRHDSFDDDVTLDGIREAECLYDFSEDGEGGCITITPGMRLIVTEEDTGDGWTKVKQSGGVTEGFVPTSYIRLL